MATAESLFAAEAALRTAAVSFADWDRASHTSNPTRSTNLNAARKELRLAARTYAKLAGEND